MPDSADLSRVSPPDDEQLLSVAVGTHGGHALLRVTGEIDIMTADRFAEGLDAALGHEPASTLVLCDLSGVTFIGSHGVAALLKAATSAREGGRELRVAVPDKSVVVRSLRIGGLDNLCRIYSSLDDAADVGE